MPRHNVTDSLCFDDLSGCLHEKDRDERAIVHACKEPCHRRAVGYRDRSLPSSHPDYLHREDPYNLYLNIIDPPIPLFKPESFTIFFNFMDRVITQRPVLIHCNKGESRAPSLTLLYMAKRLNLLPDESYAAAAAAFAAQFPYKPGKGIATYLTENWAALGKKEN